MMPIEQAKSWYNDFVSFTSSILKQDLDYGVVPGTGSKPSLYKPGAEKLRFVYGLGIEFECIDKVVDIDRPFVDYSYKCTVKTKTGQVIAQCEGSCNSMEPKYGYVWKSEHEIPASIDKSTLQSKTTGKKITEFDFSIRKAETTGQYGKPQEYWDKWKKAIETGKARKTQKKTKAGDSKDAWELDDTVTLYRVPNPDVMGLKNTIMKMAQKRAFVGAVLLATGASEFFTQDIEDLEIDDAPPVVTKSAFEEAQVIDDDKELLSQWQLKLNECKTIDDLLDVYNKNKHTIDSWTELRQLFTNRKMALNGTATTR